MKSDKSEKKDSFSNESMNEIVALKAENASLRSKLEQLSIVNTESFYFRDIVEHSNSIIYRFNAKENRVDYISKKAEGYLGYSLSEQIAKDLRQIAAEVEPDDWTELINKAEEIRIKTGSNIVQDEFFYRRLDKQGRYRQNRDFMTFIFDINGTVEFIMGAVEDISSKQSSFDNNKNIEIAIEQACSITGDTYFLYDTITNEIKLSKQLLKLLGWSDIDIEHNPDNLSILDKSIPVSIFIEYLHDEDREIFTNILNELDSGAKSISSFEFKIKNSNDSYLSFIAKCKANIENSADRSHNIYFILKNITALKQREIRLCESEKKLRNFFRALPEGCAIIDCKGAVTNWNPSLEKITGIQRDSAIGKYIWDVYYKLIPEEIRTSDVSEQMKVSTLEFLRTGQSEYFQNLALNQIQNLDGSLKTLQSTIYPLIIDGITYAGFVVRDITGEVIIKEEMSENEKRLREFFDHSRDILYRLALKERKFEYVSPSVFTILGYNQDEFEKLGENEISKLLHPDSLNYFFEFLNKLPYIALEDGAEYEHEYQILHRDGSYRWLSDKQKVFFNENGEPESLIGTIRDITDEKKVLQALESSEERYKILSSELRGILDAIPEALTLLTPDLEVKWANKAAVNKFKSSQSKVTGRKCYELWHDSSEPCSTCPVLDSLKTGKPFSITVNRADGTINEVRTAPIFDYYGKVVSVIELSNDVTGIKMTEENLRLSEEKYRLLVEHIQSGIYIIQNERFVYANKRFCDISGYTLEEIIGKNIMSLTAPEDLDIIMNTYRRRLEGENAPISYNYRILHKDGTRVLVNRRGDLITIGGETATMGVVTPITDQNLLENIHKAFYKISSAANFANNLNDFYKFIYQAINELLPAKNFYVALCDWESKTLSFPFYVDEYDSPEPSSFDFIPFGKGLTEYILKNGRTEIITAEKFNELAEAGEAELIGTNSHCYIGSPMKTADGRIIGILAVQTYNENDNFSENDKDILSFISAQVAMAIDRIQATEAQIVSESRYKLLVENAFDAIYLIRDMKYEYVNDMFCQITGYKFDELTSPDFNYETLLTEESKKIMLERYVLRKENKPISPRYELQIVNKSGKVLDVEVSTVSIGDESEIAVLGIMRDITNRKKAEKAIQNLNKELEEKVQQRTAQLETALQELKLEIAVRLAAEEKLIESKNEITKAFEREKQLSDLKTRFISMISHEYRTPLTIIMTSTYLIERFYKLNDEEKLMQKITMIRSAIASMIQLLENVLTVGRFDSNEMILNLSNINIAEFCRHIIKDFNESNNCRISFATNNEELFAKTDIKMLRMILINILSNAVKFSSPDSVRELELIDNYSCYTITISDGGIGIPEEDMANLYAPFFRARNIGAITGTGMGLAIVKKCIEKISGNISINSKLNEGTQVTLQFKKIF